VIGISRDQWPLAMAALALGGDVRVGLEDNFYLPSGEMARSNGDLVAAAVKLVALSGRNVATRDEARALLWPNGGGNFSRTSGTWSRSSSGGGRRSARWAARTRSPSSTRAAS